VRLLPLAAALLWLGACAHGGSASSAPTRASAQGHYYADGEGLSVFTTGALVEQPVSSGLSVEVKALADHIRVDTADHVHVDEGNPDTGHGDEHVDVVSGASQVVVGGEKVREWRFEGGVALKLARRMGAVPLTLAVSGQVSSEPDYTALAGKLSGTVELFERNTAVSAFVGFGSDEVSPLQAPPGEGAFWPARHQRWVAGGSLTQLLTPTLMASAGLGASYQSGRLSSPYRRAWVRTSLFPESLPEQRFRFTGYGGLSWALASGLGLHVRQGVYVDSWGVQALAPEASLAAELGARGLLSVRYRFYRQWPATFYSPRYEDLVDVRSSDVRLGALREHQPGVRLAWTLAGRRGAADAWSVHAGYGVSWLEHLQVGDHLVRSQVVSLGVQGGF
jgi:hypothetical protein